MKNFRLGAGYILSRLAFWAVVIGGIVAFAKYPTETAAAAIVLMVLLAITYVLRRF